uniref:Uncharacterized protein n=1 Tax=Cucumis melo TaxID=3656 RepID=A0A9I9EDJ7_CUCME
MGVDAAECRYARAPDVSVAILIRVPFDTNSYTSRGTSVSRQHPISFTTFRWLIWVRIMTSLMNCSIWLSSTILDFLMATVLPSGRIPLYTVPFPPLPRIRVSA